MDADSEGEEGRFYLWDKAEPRDLLNETEFAIVARHYGLARRPNFEGTHWHLHVAELRADCRRSESGKPRPGNFLMAHAARCLPGGHCVRHRPAMTSLVSWNALMIQGLARAARSSPGPTG